MLPGGLTDYFLNTTSEAAEAGTRVPVLGAGETGRGPSVKADLENVADGMSWPLPRRARSPAARQYVPDSRCGGMAAARSGG